MKSRTIFLQPKFLWLAVTAVYICVIYGHSLTPADISSKESGFLLMKLHGLMEAAGFNSARLTEHMVRKTAHFAEYTGLGLLLCVNCRIWLPEGRIRLRTAFELAFLIPFVDETIQLFVPGRSGQVSDVWLDVGGVMFGLALAAYFAGLRQRRMDGKEWTVRKNGPNSRMNGRGDKG